MVSLDHILKISLQKYADLLLAVVVPYTIEVCKLTIRVPSMNTQFPYNVPPLKEKGFLFPSTATAII